jgi:hypothetical protein
MPVIVATVIDRISKTGNDSRIRDAGLRLYI